MFEGIVLSGLPRTTVLFDGLIDAGRCLGGQIFAATKDELVIDAGFGCDADGRKLDRRSLTHWFCATKPLAALAFMRYWERGHCHPDQCVTEVLPDFPHALVTFRHLLTHTSGVNCGKDPDVRPVRFSGKEVLKRAYESRLEFPPGTRARYSFEGWFVLAHALERIGGRNFSQLVKVEVLRPLGLDRCFVGMAPGEFSRVSADLVSHCIHRAGRTKDVPLRILCSRRFCCADNPASGGIGPVSGLGKVFWSVLRGGELDGRKLLSPQSCEAMTANQRTYMFDRTYLMSGGFGLGVMVDLRHWGVGRSLSRRSYGHPGGVGTTLVVADPETLTVIAVSCVGGDMAATGLYRWRQVVDAIHLDINDYRS